LSMSKKRRARLGYASSKLLPLIALAGGLGIGTGFGWYLKAHRPPVEAPLPVAQGLYRCPMHPWITSSSPDRCSICGMQMVLISEKRGDSQLVTLPSSSITAMGVQTSLVHRTRLTRILTVAGALQSDLGWHPPSPFTAPASGVVTRIYAPAIGQHVKAGDPMLDITSPELLSARREFWTLSHAATKAASPEAVVLARRRLTQLGLSDAQIDQLAQATEFDPATTILAPFFSTLTDMRVSVGQSVAAGAPLFSLLDLRALWFVFEVREQDLDWLKAGQPMEVTVPAHAGKCYNSTVSSIDPAVDLMAQTAHARAKLLNNDGTLFENLSALGRIEMRSEEVLAAPRSAILNTGTVAVAYLDEGNGKYLRRRVTLGLSGDDEVEIVSGLAAGDKVVTTAALLLDAEAEMDNE
jgi:Cu(I)/Ag(I) efflux system membrane fusion protein